MAIPFWLTSEAIVFETDVSAPALPGDLCFYSPAGGGAPIDTQGRYQVLLSANRAHALEVWVQPGLNGRLVFPQPPHQVNLPADSTQNFQVGSLPGAVTILGVVRDTSGRAVRDVTVLAESQEISGTPNARFAGGSITDAKGRYTFEVLSGRNYKLTFTPPRPMP